MNLRFFGFSSCRKLARYFGNSHHTHFFLEMNYQHFEYPRARDTSGASATPTSSALVAHNKPQPLRVTPDAIEPLFFALAFTIEYALAVGKKDGPLAVFSPQISSSDMLGGVTYIEVEAHSQALLDALSRATITARQLPFRGASVPLKLRVRVSRNVPTKSFFSVFATGFQKHVIAVWEFKIIKTKTESMAQGSASFAFHSPVTQGVAPLAGGDGRSRAPSNVNSAGSPNSTDDSQPMLGAAQVYSNDAQDIRQALHQITRDAFTAIDAEWYKDLRAGDLIYEVDVIDR